MPCFCILQGTISFGVGFFFVIIGWPILGMMLEAYGFIVLFRSVGFNFSVFGFYGGSLILKS